MRYLCMLSLTLLSIISFGQNTGCSDSIPLPIYDTINIEIESHNSFPFCGKIYKIRPGCNDTDRFNCCRYSTHISRWQARPRFGQLGCNNGTSLIWMYHEPGVNTKLNFEYSISQTEKMMKSFSKEKIYCLIANQKLEGYKLWYKNEQGYSWYQISVYGIIDGQNISLDLYSIKEINCNEDIQASIRQIFELL